VPADEQQFEQVGRYERNDPGGDHQNESQQHVESDVAVCGGELQNLVMPFDEDDEATGEQQAEQPDQYLELSHTRGNRPRLATDTSAAGRGNQLNQRLKGIGPAQVAAAGLSLTMICGAGIEVQTRPCATVPAVVEESSLGEGARPPE